MAVDGIDEQVLSRLHRYVSSLAFMPQLHSTAHESFPGSAGTYPYYSGLIYYEPAQTITQFGVRVLKQSMATLEGSIMEHMEQCLPELS